MQNPAACAVLIDSCQRPMEFVTHFVVDPVLRMLPTSCVALRAYLPNVFDLLAHRSGHCSLTAWPVIAVRHKATALARVLGCGASERGHLGISLLIGPSFVSVLAWQVTLYRFVLFRRIGLCALRVDTSTLVFDGVSVLRVGNDFCEEMQSRLECRPPRSQ